MRWPVAIVVMLAAFAVFETHASEERSARRSRLRPPADRRRRVKVSDPTPAGARVVCFFSSSTIAAIGLAKFEPLNINPHLCTHLVYVEATINSDNEMVPSRFSTDVTNAGYAKTNALKKYNRNLRTLIGPSMEDAAQMRILAGKPESRASFINSTIMHLRRYNFDGLYFQWTNLVQKENMALLVKELRESFENEAMESDKPRLILTMRISQLEPVIDAHYDVPSLNENVDFFMVKVFDYYAGTNPTTNHLSPLRAMPMTSVYEDSYKLNMDWTLKYFVKLGAARDKVVAMMTPLSISFTLQDPAITDFGALAKGEGKPGNYTGRSGILSYYEVCLAISVDSWQVRRPYPLSVGPFAFKGDQWVAYDDEVMMATKGRYVRDNGLGGIAMVFIEFDDFRGVCNGRPYPMTEAAKSGLLSDPNTDADPLELVSLYRNLPSTPLPPTTPVLSTTPAPVAAFQCPTKGSHPDPLDCHRYFRCLESSVDGALQAHAITCPGDLVFSMESMRCEDITVPRTCIKEQNSNTGSVLTFPTTTPIPDYDYYDVDYSDSPQDDPTVTAHVPLPEGMIRLTAPHDLTINRMYLPPQVDSP